MHTIITPSICFIAAASVSAHAAANVIISDTFSGTNVKWNEAGEKVWHHKNWRQKSVESNGSLVTTTRGSWGNGGLISRNTYDAWNSTGLTYSWTHSDVNATKLDAGAHEHRNSMAVLNTSMTSPGHAVRYWNKGGGLYVDLDYEAGDGTGPLIVTGKLMFAHADKTKKNHDNITHLANFAFNGYDGIGALTTNLHVNATGITLGFESDVMDSITWSGAYAGNSVGHTLSVNWDTFASSDEAFNIFATGTRIAALTNASKYGRASSSLNHIAVSAGSLSVAPVPAPGALLVIAGAGGCTLARRRRA